MTGWLRGSRRAGLEASRWERERDKLILGSIVAGFATGIALSIIGAVTGNNGLLDFGKYIVSFFGGALIGAFSPKPGKDTVEVSAPENYKIEVEARIREE